MEPARLSFEQFVLGNVTRRGFHRKELGYLHPLIRRRFWISTVAIRRGHCASAKTTPCMPVRWRLERAFYSFRRRDMLRSSGRICSARDTAGGTSKRCEIAIRELMAMTHLAPSEREALAKHYADIDRRTQWLVTRRGVAIAQLSERSVYIFPFARVEPVPGGTSDRGGPVADKKAP